MNVLLNWLVNGNMQRDIIELRKMISKAYIVSSKLLTPFFCNIQYAMSDSYHLSCLSFCQSAQYNWSPGDIWLNFSRVVDSSLSKCLAPDEAVYSILLSKWKWEVRFAHALIFFSCQYKVVLLVQNRLLYVLRQLLCLKLV